MAAVVRVKRRLNDEPLDALILNCKKRKTAEAHHSEESESATLLEFAGTAVSQDEDIFTHLNKPARGERQIKKRNVDLSAKLRAQTQADSRNSRYKVVNCFRSQEGNVQEQTNPEQSNSPVTIYDIETENHEDCLDNQQIAVNYVYDLYYTTSDDLGDVHLEDYIHVYPYNSDNFILDSKRDNELDDSDDSEDSNAECNWRNDYPDESDMESVTEDDMFEAMKKVNLNDGLSSDDGEEGFVYSVDSEAAGFEEDIDDTDVQRYGERYARFKARHKNTIQTTELDKDFYYGDIDEEEYCN